MSTILGKRGYVLESAKAHPRAGRDGYVPQHILVVEQAIGHVLDPRHKVHHVDGNTGNNSNRNLVACEDQAYHLLLHQRKRALEACGDPSARKCNICGSYERQWDIVLYPYRRTGRQDSTQARHRECNRNHVAKHAK